MQSRIGRHSRTLIAAVAATAAAVLAISASATLVAGTLNAADGDLIVTGSEIDWASPAPGLKKAQDKPTGQTDDSFGQGTKEDTAVPTVVDGSIPNNKSDLTRFYVGNDKVSGDDFLYLAWERVQEPSGTTNMDFEFNQSGTASANGVTPVRQAGDLLIKYDLSQGGVNPTLGYHRWVATGPSSLCEAANRTPCWGPVQPLSGANFEGKVNTDTVTDPILIGDQTDPRSLSPRTFGEASINLTDSGILDTSVCTTFGSAYLKSRSSDSFTAALKDFIAPIPVNITNCGSIKVIKKDSATQANLGGATFTLFHDVAPTAPVQTSHGIEDTAVQATGGGDLTCTTAAITGTCTFSNVPFGKYWVVETTPPSGYSAAPDQAVTLDGTNPTAELTFLDVQQKGSVSIVKADDNGVLMNGVTFTLTGTSDLGGAVSEECTTAGTGTEAGRCTISDVPLGTYSLAEGAVPTGYSPDPDFPISVSITTDGQVVPVSVVNPRQHRVIVIVCHEGDDTLYPVTVDGGTDMTSIGDVPDHLEAKEVTEADLCDIGGASFGGLDHGDKTVTAEIAGH